MSAAGGAGHVDPAQVPNRDGRTLEFESGLLGALDAFLMPGGGQLSAFLIGRSRDSSILKRYRMDVLHVALGAVLWLSMVGMALGCERIRGRPRAAETPVDRDAHRLPLRALTATRPDLERGFIDFVRIE
jgi:hypothetical protein